MQRRTDKHKKRRYSFSAGLLIGTLLLLILVAVGVFFFKPFDKKITAQVSSSAASTSHSSSSAPATTTSSSTPKSTWLTSGAQPNQLPTLMFHYVSSKPSDLVDSNWMPTATFEADLQALKSAGYTTVTAAEAEKIITTNQKPSNKMVWLTFDDGSVTLYRDIFPLLKKYQMHATGFIITSFVDNGQSGILNWAQIKEMAASGLVDFQSHTVSHIDLGTASTADATYQLQQSKQELDSQLNQKTNIICYPAGGHNDQTLTIAKSLGYQYGLLDPGRYGGVAEAASSSQGLLTLNRFRMASTTGPAELMADLTAAATFNTQNTQAQ